MSAWSNKWMMASNAKLSAPFEVVELSKIANYKNFSDLFDGYPTFINRKKTQSFPTSIT